MALTQIQTLVSWQRAQLHLVHDITKRQAILGITEGEAAARTGMTEGAAREAVVMPCFAAKAIQGIELKTTGERRRGT